MAFLRDFADDTLRAVAFLSRLRVPDRVFAGHDGRLGRTVRAFPVAGVLIALPAGLTLALLAALGADPLLAALVAVSLQTLVTGALHEDGLADMADGLGGGRDRAHALEIMKDSRIGTYGVLALVLTVALRTAAIAALVPALGAAGCGLVLVAVAALSRAAMVWHWSKLPPARAEGVAARAGRPERAAVLTALATGLLLSAPALAAAGLPPGPALLALLAGLAVVPPFTRYVETRISGHTGDTIGATQQVSESALLVTLAVLA